MIENANKNAVRLRKRYCKELRKELSDAPQLRGRAVRDIQNSLDEYLEKNPAAGWLELEQTFGSPKQAADNILNDLDVKQIKQEAKRFRWRWIAMITIIGVAMVYALFYCGRLIINRFAVPNSVVIGPAVVDEEPIPTNPPYPEEAPLLW